MVSRRAITWIVMKRARPVTDDVRRALGDGYEDNKAALQEFLCDYFRTGSCSGKQGSSISPIASTKAPPGFKALKVRWLYPNCGKSGGLRLAVIVNCTDKIVKLCGAWKRSTDPTAAEFDDAVEAFS